MTSILRREAYPYSASGFDLEGRELEARVGYFSSGGSRSFQGATQDQYLHVLAWLRQEYPDASDYQEAKTAVRLYPDDIRMIAPSHEEDHMVFWDPDHELGQDSTQKWEKKLKASKLQVDIMRRGIRFAISQEVPVPKLEEPTEPNTVRYRSRITAVIGTGQVDLTRTVTVAAGKTINWDAVTYEIEVEYIGDSDELADNLDDFYDLVEDVYIAANTFDGEPGAVGLPHTMEEREGMIHYVLDRLSDGVQLRELGRRISVKDYLAKPRSMKKQDLVAAGLYGLQPRRGSKGEPEKYYVTYKSDGVRSLLVNDRTGLWIYYPGTYTRLVARNGDDISHPAFIMDGEFIDSEAETPIFIPFDLLAVLGFDATQPVGSEERHPWIDMTVASYTDRLSLLAQSRRGLPDFERVHILDKDIILLDNMDSEAGFQTLARMLEDREAQPFETDGLIFTPADQPYHLSSSTGVSLSSRILSAYPDVIKWKPPTMLTVDFEISRSSIDEITLLSNKGGYGNPSVAFEGTDRHPFNQSMVNSRASLTRGLPDKTIVEYEWDNQKKWFTPHRLRTDKSSPNSLEVALDNWNSIHDPIEEIDLLRGYSRAPNIATALVKTEIYDRTISAYQKISRWDLLEVGSGQGGELERWKKLPPAVKRIITLEPNRDFIREMNARIENQEDLTWRAVPIPKKAEDSSVIADLIKLKTGSMPGRKTVRLATSSMLSGSFFGDSPNRLRRFVHLMTRGNQASFYTISVEGLETAIGSLENWVIGHTYEIYPALVTVVSLEPPTIRYRNIQSTTAGDQVEYPLRITELVAELEAHGFKAEIPDLTKFTKSEIPTVRRYMGMYQYVRAITKSKPSLDDPRLLALPLTKGDQEALGATDYSDLVRTRRSATTIDGAILGQLPTLAKKVAKDRKADPKLRNRAGLLVRDAMTSDLETDETLVKRLEHFLTQYSLGLKVFDLDTGTLIYTYRPGRGQADLMISRTRSQLGDEPKYVYDRVTRMPSR